MYNHNDYDRFLIEEERKLMRELGSQRMSWSKLGKIIKLGAIMRAYNNRRAY